MENIFKQVADELKNADFLLLVTGAGFSADSGLPVYADIANDPKYKDIGLSYFDICNQNTIDNNPELFYNFFASTINQYKNTIPHKGYNLLLQVKEKYFSQNKEFESEMKQHMVNNITSSCKTEILNHIPGPFFCYTSNVDGHFRASGFLEEEIEEMHGCIDFWQCCNPSLCNFKINDGLWWWLPRDYKFPDKITINKQDNSKFKLITEKPPISGYFRKTEEIITKHSFNSIIPKCIGCGGLARPNIVMFNDCNFVDGIETSFYLEWEKIVESFCNLNETKVVILEIGCGMNVPSLRVHTEELLQKWKFAKLVRINPSDCSYNFIKKTDNEIINRIITIKSGALNALEGICKYLL